MAQEGQPTGNGKDAAMETSEEFPQKPLSALRLTACHVALIVAVTSVVYFTNLGGAKLWDRDEPRNAGCAREMIERNDWVTPYFNGELRTHKPVLTYWLMMVAYGLFGVSEFSARFWSAALGIGTSLATYVIARRLFSPAVGMWAGLVMGTSLMFCLASRAATPDAPLIFCSTMAMMCYVVGTFRAKGQGEENSPPQTRLPGCYFPGWTLAALMYGWMGLGVLAKGPIGLVLPTAVIGMFLLLMRLPRIEKSEATSVQPPQWTAWHTLAVALLAIEMFIIDRIHGGMTAFAVFAIAVVSYALLYPGSLSRRLIRPFAPGHFLATCWTMRPLTALAVSLGIALPWYIWVGLRTDGAWLEGFFFTHNLARATQAMEGHAGTYLFYPVSTLAGLFPWSILMVPAIVALIQQVRQRQTWMMGYLFATCWIGVYIGLFSLARTKLPSYVTPAYPALAIIVSAYIVSWSRSTLKQSVWTPRLAFGSLAIVGVGLTIALPIAASKFLPGEMWLGVLGVIPIVAALCGFVFSAGRRPTYAAMSLGACAVAMLLLAFGVVGPRVSQHQPIDKLLAPVCQSSDQPLLAAHRTHEPSWVFYAGQAIPIIGHRDEQEVSEFLRQPDAFLITTERAFDHLKRQLPEDVEIVARERFFLRDHDLVVIGRTADGVQLARRKSDGSELR